MFRFKGEPRDARCVLCSRTKAQVKWLVVGVVGAVCSDCIALAVPILGDKLGDAGAPHRTFRPTRKLEIMPGERSGELPIVVQLDPDVADVFPDSGCVNAALQPIAQLIKAEAARLHAQAKQDA